MDHLSIKEGLAADGLRLVLSAGVPGPWGESAKAMFAVKNIPFSAVAQSPGAANEDLLAWTGQTSAPVAVYNNERIRSQSLEILYLAERLNPRPALIPQSIEQRVQMFGLIRELIGEEGFAWNRRLLMVRPLVQAEGMEEMAGRMGGKYGHSEAAADMAAQRCAEFLRYFGSLLGAQLERGSRYFIGDCLSALDIYWAQFSSMVVTLPHDENPMNAGMRAVYEDVDPAIKEALDPALIEHRDYIFEHYNNPARV